MTEQAQRKEFQLHVSKHERVHNAGATTRYLGSEGRLLWIIAGLVYGVSNGRIGGASQYTPCDGTQRVVYSDNVFCVLLTQHTASFYKEGGATYFAPKGDSFYEQLSSVRTHEQAKALHMQLDALQVQAQAEAKNEAVQNVVNDVRERGERYGFQPDEDMVREAVEESANLLSISLTERQIVAACHAVMQD